MQASVDPWYYDGESSGYWVRSPTYEWDRRYLIACERACNAGIACWLLKYEPDLPF
jgi:hypothetical protein